MENSSPLPSTIAVIGGGSWATALAKLLLNNLPSISWYMRRQDRIDEFIALGHNPAYLTDAQFDTSRINFTTDLDAICRDNDILLLATPSPYFKSHFDNLTADISAKTIVNAIKGIVPDENILITDFMTRHFGVDPERQLVISGPCHAEEVALDRPSYLTVGCRDLDLAENFASMIRARNAHVVTSTDLDGIEYAGVLKNVYAIASGMVHGMKRGDNLTAVLVSNAVREMNAFLDAVAPHPTRHICETVYLGDLLVTAYSQFSRNHNFGSMIGKGYAVKAARMEMEQTAEGYYGAKCIHEINLNAGVEMPILNTVYDILYRRVFPEAAFRRLAKILC